MKKINFNLITLSILSFFLCTLFITSCTKEQATFTLPVEMADEDFNVIQINDIDIQEFIRVRNSVVNQSDDNEIEAITMLVDKLITYKENLQEKYPNQQFEDLSVAEFFQKMNDAYPIANYSRNADCEICKLECGVAALEEKVRLWKLFGNDPILDVLFDIVDDNRDKCRDKCEEDHGNGSGSGSGSGCGSGSGG